MAENLGIGNKSLRVGIALNAAEPEFSCLKWRHTLIENKCGYNIFLHILYDYNSSVGVEKPLG